MLLAGNPAALAALDATIGAARDSACRNAAGRWDASSSKVKLCVPQYHPESIAPSPGGADPRLPAPETLVWGREKGISGAAAKALHSHSHNPRSLRSPLKRSHHAQTNAEPCWAHRA